MFVIYEEFYDFDGSGKKFKSIINKFFDTKDDAETYAREHWLEDYTIEKYC